MNERIKELRKTLGLTLEKFGERVGVKKSALSLVENGKNNVSEQLFFSICREFNVNDDWLRTGDGEMFNQSDEDEELAAIVGRVLAGKDEFRKALYRQIGTCERKKDGRSKHFRTRAAFRSEPLNTSKQQTAQLPN